MLYNSTISTCSRPESSTAIYVAASCIVTGLVKNGVAELRLLQESRGTACVYPPVPRHVQRLEIALEQRPVVPCKLENAEGGIVSNQRI